LKTNLAKFSGMMQGQRSITAVAQLIMSELTPLVGAQYGTFFMMDGEGDLASLNLIASYAFTSRKNVANIYRLKEGLIGQCAFEKKKILLPRVPDDYIAISSSLGESKPLTVIVLPVLFEGELKAVIELASFEPFSQNYLNFLDQLMDSIGVVLNMIASTMRTEELLQELKRSNAELEAQANELEEKAKLLEVKNQEVELASRSLEEKAEQLSLISKYKSEFLANMSHELRTPLNSLLILSKTLAENRDKNLTPEQVKFATTVYSAGTDLLALINEILDLSKVEAGKMQIDPSDLRLSDVQDYLDQTFRPVAEHKGLQFQIETGQELPRKIFTDNSRLQQVLKNLLSNAFKFTEQGKVTLRVDVAAKDHPFEIETLRQARKVISFSVTDTGIGIPREKQKLIFEAFQQADGTTSRKYGGTGLGLTISREIARLLGGSIEVQSTPGIGSTFTLYLPQNYTGADAKIIDRSDAEAAPLVPKLPDGADFSNRRILVVDDDMRNIYAITSVLEARGMKVIYAENGRVALKLLQDNPGIDLVLMDTMMPEMDGIEATQQIRKMTQFADLPIISLTAKAMKGDREKAISAGASDYVTKPVDPDRLLSVMHMWIQKTAHDAVAHVAQST
jgi:signal transduction histidine kinase/AmiR/NasT family two-component response regulator